MPCVKNMSAMYHHGHRYQLLHNEFREINLDDFSSRQKGVQSHHYLVTQALFAINIHNILV